MPKVVSIDIRRILKKYNLLTKKSLGQNFIYDSDIIHKIINVAFPINTNEIVEIGPGLGSLTNEILNVSSGPVYCIEKDINLKSIHLELFDHKKNINFIYQDVLKTNLKDIVHNRCTIISNLPYYISTAILIKLFKDDFHCIDKMVLMFQKEVAERICAPINTKQYGKISVLSQLLCDVQIMFDVPPNAFIPKPKVTSSVIVFKMKKIVDINIDRLMELLNICFQSRRKMVGTILKKHYRNTDNVLRNRKQLRPENISPETFLQLSTLLETK